MREANMCTTWVCFVGFVSLTAMAADGQFDIQPPKVVNASATGDSGPDENPDVAFGDGKLIAVWDSNDSLGGSIGTDSDILYAVSTNDGFTWISMGPLNINAPSDSGNDEYPRIAFVDSGRWIVVWESDDSLGGMVGSDRDIFYSISTNNGASWSAPAALNGNADIDSGADIRPTIESDGPGGNVIVAWESTDTLGGTLGVDKDILVARSSDFGASFMLPTALNSNAAMDSGDDARPRLRTNHTGEWVIVWQSNDSLGGMVGTDFDIFFSRSVNNGATWGMVQALNDNADADSGDDTAPDVASDGVIFWGVVWQSNDAHGGTVGTDNDIFVAASFNNGVSWTDAAPLTAFAATDSAIDTAPYILCDSIGRWVVVWQSTFTLGGMIGSDFDILAARTGNPGTSWTPPVAMNSSATADVGTDAVPALAFNDSGDWLAIWDANEDLGGTIGVDFDILAAPFGLIGGSCQGSGQCDDDDPCTDHDMCIGGICLGLPVDCDDGNLCTVDDQCKDGACVFTPIHCFPGQTCDPQTGTCGCNNDSECDDGIFCNGQETCVDGDCLNAAPIDCNDGVSCTVDTCNEANQSCDHETSSALCDDGLFCNGAETCSPILGCLNGFAPCTGQLCRESDDQCVDCLTFSDCNDSDPCNGAEPCGPAGVCLPSSIGADCNNNDREDACDLDDGDSIDCNENKTPDECDIASGASQDADQDGVPDECCSSNDSCNDGDVCSFDVCTLGVCTHQATARGDVVGSGGVCGPDGDVNLFDILAILDGFQDSFAAGCELVNMDIASSESGCQPDGEVNLFDILAVLDGFLDLPTCCP